MQNRECTYCKEIISFDNPRKFGAHLTNCKMNPSKLERDEKSKKKKIFNFTCKCGTDYEVETTEHNINNGNYKKFCSRKCANSRNHSDETKEKIRKGVNKSISINVKCDNNRKIKENKIEYKICLNCKTEFSNRNKKFCSSECGFNYNKSNKKIDYSKLIDFKFSDNTSDDIQFIYELSYNDKPFYIGKSKDPYERFYRHKRESKLKRTHKEKFINKILSSGDKIELNIIDEVDYSNIDYWERFWISYYKTLGIKLLNSTDGGCGGNCWVGKKHSEETKEKLSIIRKEFLKNNPNISNDCIKGELNHNSKLCVDDVNKIRTNYSSGGFTHRSLAEMYGVSKTAIKRILDGKAWKDV